MSEKTKILVVDGYLRNSLAILRSLSPKGYHCDIIVQEHAVKPYGLFEKAFRSKYAKKVHTLNRTSEEQLVKDLLKILEAGNYACMMAGGTYFSNFISKYKEVFSKYTKVLSESHEKMAKVHNKESCMALADSIGVRIPKTYVAHNETDLIKIAEETNGNVIVKLEDSFASKGLIKYTQGKQFFIDNYKRDFGFNINETNKPLVQQFIEGDLIDATAFAVGGDTKAVLTQKRVLTAWLEGGGGIVNITNDVADVKAGAKKMLEHLNWTGHLEMDWIQDKSSGDSYLIEINPKFWGTTQLTISSGYDYPYWYVKHALGEPIEYPETYTQGLQYRWLDDELVTILTQPKSIGSFFCEIGKSLGRFFASNTKTNFFITDPKPFVKGLADAMIVILKTWFFGKK